MANRDEILGNFQAMTGLEDLAMCMEILEQKGWDLTAAVNSMMPQPEYPQLPSQPPTTEASAPRTLGFIDLTTQTPTQVSLPDRSHPYVDLSTDSAVVGEVIPSGPTIELSVFFGTRVIKLHMPYLSTVAQVKEQLQLKSGLRPDKQILIGWPGSPPSSDQDNLASLGLTLGGSHSLTLEHVPPATSYGPPPPPPYSQVAALSSSLAETISGFSSRSMPVVVGSQVTNRVVHNPPTINVDVQEETRRESHSPVVVSSPSSSSHYSDAADAISSDEEEAVMESLDDGIFEDSGSSLPSKAIKDPLIPHGCLEPYEALQFFTHGFEARYGAMHPLFLIGSLTEAVREATSASALSGARKPMFIYLHHDGSILSNIFCSQLLCSESVVNYLTSNYVCWAWDLTHHQARIKLLQMVEECFGKMAKISVDEIRADHLPAILIVYKVKGSTDIKNIIQGETNLDSLMTSLISAVDDHNVNIDMEGMEERERIRRGQMIREQNRAYEESLIADQEKARQREEEERARIEKEQQEEKERNDREEQLAAMEVCVPDEPPADCGEKMCTLRIRYPDGSQTTRRFLAVHQLQDLLNLLGSQGYLTSDYKILTSFPRRDISEGNPSDSLEQCRLCPQETLFVEER